MNKLLSDMCAIYGVNYEEFVVYYRKSLSDGDSLDNDPDNGNNCDLNNDKYDEIISICRKILPFKKNSDGYRKKSDEYYASYNDIHKIRTKNNDILQECKNIINEIKNNNNNSDKADKILSVVPMIMTPHERKKEIIKYYINYYSLESNDNKIIINHANLNESSCKIKEQLDMLSEIFMPAIEDKKWKINTERKYNFDFPKTHVVFSNTTTEKYSIDNDELKENLLMMTKYLSRITNSTKVKYHIIDDNKYYVHWILISVQINK